MKRTLMRKLGALSIAISVAMFAAPANALIVNADIANNAGIAYGKLKIGGKIDSGDIKNGSIQGKDIKNGTISGSKIKDDAIDSDKIEDGSITVDDLAAGTLTATSLADGAVTSAKILDSTIASADIAADTIVAADIATGGVATAEILDGTILTGDISTGGVTTGNILDGTIAAADLATSAVTSAKILDETIASADILDGTIAAADLATNLALSTTGSVTTTGTGTITSAGLMTASGGLTVVGDLLATPQSAAATAAEGTIYYDSDDDNLYVYANGGWVDLTAGAAGAVTLDDAYNASAGASTVLVDNGDLTLRSNSIATGDIIIDLANTSDFILQDNGTDVITFSDSGNLTMASGTLALNNDAVTSDGDLTITGATGLNATATTGDLDVTSTAGSIILTAGENAADSVQIISSIGGIDITAAAATAEDIDILDTGGSINITATEAAADAIVLNASTALGGIDIASNADIDITTTGADGEDISLTNTGGSVNITATEAAADAIVLNASTAAGGIDITSNADIDITTTGASGEDITIDNTGGSVNITASENATDAVVITASAGGINLAATGAATEDITLINTGGSVGITATEGVEDAIVLNASTAAGGIDITSNADIDMTTTGAAGEDITITNTGGSVNINATEADASAILVNASAGGLNIDSALAMDIDTAAGNIVIDSVDGAAGAIVPEDDGEDDLGTDATRWSAIYADTLNYRTALTDDASDDTTVTMGDANDTDVVNITAKTAIDSEHWSITEPGVATFVSVDGPLGSVTPAAIDATTIQLDAVLTFDTNDDSVNNSTDATFDFTRNDAGTVTITASDDNANADMLLVAGGTGDMTLGDADSDTTVAGVFAANGATTIGDGGDNVAVNSDVWDINAAGAATGLTGIVSSGTISFTGSTIGFGDNEADAITLTGDTTIGAGASNNVVVDSNTWDVNAAGVASGLTGVTSTGTVDFSGATLEVPNGTDLPATCSVGMIFHDTNDDACADADAGDGALCICKSANTWAAVANF